MTCDNEGQPIVMPNMVVTKKVISGDINGDGFFDKTDLTLAGKILVKGKKK